MKKKESSQNVHDAKKYLGVATGDEDMILLQLSIFFSSYHDIAPFLLATSKKCVKLKKKILVKLL